MGDRYRVGDHLIERDDGEALRWYRAAAEQGDAEAQNNLGSMYLNGVGVAKNAEMATTLYRRAAEQGLDVAQFNLALNYLHGTGVEQDDRVAAQWLVQATAQGHVEATGQLGTLYRFGRGVAQDLVTAAELHVLAAGAGDPTSLGNLCDHLKDLEQIALGGDTSASVSLATVYDRGLGIGQDQPTALAWTRWARAHCTPEVDEHVREALERLEFEHVIMGTADVELITWLPCGHNATTLLGAAEAWRQRQYATTASPACQPSLPWPVPQQTPPSSKQRDPFAHRLVLR